MSHIGWLVLMFPLFISHVRLRRRTGKLPQANTDWALDSGGFSELDRHGRWETQLEDYVAAVARYQAEIGHLEWAAPMDWMCEPHMLAKTGKTVREHQRLTVQNFLELRTTGLPFIPVLQGWTEDDYHYCVDLYRWVGVRLEDEPLVGVGSVCRRQHSEEIKQVISGLANRGLQLHALGSRLAGCRCMPTGCPALIRCRGATTRVRTRRCPSARTSTATTAWTSRWLGGADCSMGRLSRSRTLRADGSPSADSYSDKVALGSSTST
jgi:hypothetical protein